MPSATFKKRLTTALAAAALSSALAVSGAHAHHGSQSVPPPEVAPPASSIAASAGEEYQDLRSAGLAEVARPAATQQPGVSEPSGFDLASAAIGAAVAAGLSILLVATLAMRRPAGRRAASA